MSSIAMNSNAIIISGIGRLRGRSILSIPCLLAGVLLFTGCAALAPNGGNTANDIYDIKKAQTDMAERQASLERQLKYSLDTLDQSSQGRNDAMKTSLDEVEKRLREQIQEVQSLRSQVETLNFKLDRLDKQGGGIASGSPLPGPANSATTTPATGTTPLTSPNTATNPTTTPTGVEQLLATATAQFNAQNYTAARDGFKQALDQNPSPENKIESLYWLAASYEKLKDFDNASTYYNQLIKENPKSVKAWASVEHLANITLQKGDPNYALVYLNTIVNQYPAYPDIDRVKATIASIQQGNATPQNLPTGQPGPAPAQTPHP